MDQIGNAVYLAGSYKMAPRILIFSIVLDAEYSFYVKYIDIPMYAFKELT